jgi:hypothetical protein
VSLEPRCNFFAKAFTAVKVMGPSGAITISRELQIATTRKNNPVCRTRRYVTPVEGKTWGFENCGRIDMDYP